MLASNIYYADGSRRFYRSNASGSAAIRRFIYDRDQEIAEYEGSNTVLTRRYLRPPGSIDEPFLMIDYTANAGCTSAANGASLCERLAHQNRLGSVVAVTSNSGASLFTTATAPMLNVCARRLSPILLFSARQIQFRPPAPYQAGSASAGNRPYFKGL